MALIGYARVSRREQSLDLQRDALCQAGVCEQHLYSDIESGKKTDRAGLEAALRACRPGDTLLIWRLDRLGRQLTHLLQVIADLKARGVDVRTLTGLEIDTSTAQGMLIVQLHAALAEYERGLARERTMAGLAAARARGRKGGRRYVLTPTQMKEVRQMVAAGMEKTAIAAILKVSRRTVYRVLAQEVPHADPR